MWSLWHQLPPRDTAHTGRPGTPPLHINPADLSDTTSCAAILWPSNKLCPWSYCLLLCQTMKTTKTTHPLLSSGVGNAIMRSNWGQGRKREWSGYFLNSQRYVHISLGASAIHWYTMGAILVERCMHCVALMHWLLMVSSDLANSLMSQRIHLPQSMWFI